MPDPSELASRIEHADGASRELDVLIARLCDPSKVHLQKYVDGTERWRAFHPTGFGGWAETPHYTTSLDAALTLVPKGWHATIHARPDWPSVELREFPQPCRRTPLLHAATPALALCAAALRARASAAKGESNDG